MLDVPVEKVTGKITAPGGVSGSGSVFVINAHGDNALATLRYRLREADMQAAEEPFEAGGTRFARGSFVIRGVSQEVCEVHHNWLLKHADPMQAVRASEKTRVFENAYGEKPTAVR